MSQTMGKLGGFFTNNANQPAGTEVAGTGQTIGDLKKVGYSPRDITVMGGGTPSVGQKMARGILGGLGQGLGNAYPQPPQYPRMYQPYRNPNAFYGQ